MFSSPETSSTWTCLPSKMLKPSTGTACAEVGDAVSGMIPRDGGKPRHILKACELFHENMGLIQAIVRGGFLDQEDELAPSPTQDPLPAHPLGYGRRHIIYLLELVGERLPGALRTGGRRGWHGDRAGGAGDWAGVSGREGRSCTGFA
nr:hypothetical protein [Nonomuraea candida]